MNDKLSELNFDQIEIGDSKQFKISITNSYILNYIKKIITLDELDNVVNRLGLDVYFHIDMIQYKWIINYLNFFCCNKCLFRVIVFG